MRDEFTTFTCVDVIITSPPYMTTSAFLELESVFDSFVGCGGVLIV